MSIGEGNSLWREGEDFFKRGLLRCEFTKTPLIDRQRGFDFGVGRTEVFLPCGIFQGDQSGKPGGAFTGHRCHALYKTVWTSEIGQAGIDRSSRSSREQGGSGHGGLEVSQGIAGAVGVAPKPEKFVFENSIVDTVAAENAGIDQGVRIREGPAGSGGVFITTRPGDSTDALGEVLSLHFDGGRFSGLGQESGSGHAKTVLGKGVTMAGDLEKDLLIHQSWFIKGDQSLIVSEILHRMDCGQSDQRNGTVRCGIDHTDDKRPSRFGSLQGGRQEERDDK